MGKRGKGHQKFNLKWLHRKLLLRVKLESRNHKRELEKKKSTPTLIDENVIPPPEIIQQGVDLLNVSFEDYLEHSKAAKVAAHDQSSNVEKEAEASTKNFGGEGLKETFVEGVVQSDSSVTESDVDPTMIAPMSYVSGKKKHKGTLKKKKDYDEEDSTCIPTPDEKKKLRRKRKSHPT
ncbi:hypothetical protein Hanom_Chr02g00131341 [Helianthus anomalus]